MESQEIYEAVENLYSLLNRAINNEEDWTSDFKKGLYVALKLTVDIKQNLNC